MQNTTVAMSHYLLNTMQSGINRVWTYRIKRLVIVHSVMPFPVTHAYTYTGNWDMFEFEFVLLKPPNTNNYDNMNLREQHFHWPSTCSCLQSDSARPPTQSPACQQNVEQAGASLHPCALLLLWVTLWGCLHGFAHEEMFRCKLLHKYIQWQL